MAVYFWVSDRPRTRPGNCACSGRRSRRMWFCWWVLMWWDRWGHPLYHQLHLKVINLWNFEVTFQLNNLAYWLRVYKRRLTDFLHEPYFGTGVGIYGGWFVDMGILEGKWPSWKKNLRIPPGSDWTQLLGLDDGFNAQQQQSGKLRFAQNYHQK